MSSLEKARHQKRSRGDIEEEQEFRADIVPDNFIDKDVQNMLLPLNIMQHVFVSPKYIIKNNCIIPNNCYSYFFAACFAIFYVAIFSYRTYCRITSKSPTDYYKFSDDGTNYIGQIIVCIMPIISLYAVIFQSDSNVRLILKFLNIHRFLNNETEFKRFIVFTWISVILIFTFMFIFIAFTYISFKLPYYNIICGFLIESININIVYAIRLIKVLTQKIVLWNRKTFELQSMEDRERKDCCYKLFQAYVDILDCFDIYRICFQQTVSLFRYKNPTSHM